MMWGYAPTWGWMMFVMPVLWLAILALLVWAAARWFAPRPPIGTTTVSAPAEELLRQRYARGEIDEAMFVRMLAALRQEPRRDTAP